MRFLAAVAVVVGSLPVLAPPAAAAASTCDTPVRYTAQAQADLLKVGLLDLHALGLNLPQVANLTLATTHAGMATDAVVRSSAQAEYIDAEVLGLKLPRGPLEAKVAQVAPPTHQEPMRNNALGVDLGLAKAGTGDLLAHARWADGMSCGTQVGRAGSASAALLEATVLPGSGGAMVKASRNLSSQAETALLVRDGHPASAAAALVGLASLELLGTGSAAVVIKVIHPPQLTAVATGRKQSSTVEYQSPILEISGPGLPTQRLDAPGRTIDIPLPANMLGSVLNGLGGLLQSLPMSGLAQATVLRLSLGELQQQITDREVTATATSLRLQLFTTRTGPGAAESSLLDLSIGLLRASATAPQWIEPVPVDNGCGGPGCRLPTTGWKVTAAVAAGILLFIAGRFMLVLTGKRPGRRNPTDPHLPA